MQHSTNTPSVHPLDLINQAEYLKKEEMRNIKYVLITTLVVSFLILNGCKEGVTEPGYTITGKIINIPDSTKILLYDIAQAINVDSAYTQERLFQKVCQ